jgi:hypothetical protein
VARLRPCGQKRKINSMVAHIPTDHKYCTTANCQSGIGIQELLLRS